LTSRFADLQTSYAGTTAEAQTQSIRIDTAVYVIDYQSEV
jgi:hypothetical protein